MKHRVFDEEFKKMAVELSKVKNSVKEAAVELGLVMFVYSRKDLMSYFLFNGK